ncbi:hypothetical protein DFH09DRAFT_1377278 [Mycena vulgaris]|nr:hypothetical protein DFH09DRAFT_1377278 [Mycena vulgaris]
MSDAILPPISTPRTRFHPSLRAVLASISSTLAFVASSREAEHDATHRIAAAKFCSCAYYASPQSARPPACNASRQPAAPFSIQRPTALPRHAPRIPCRDEDPDKYHEVRLTFITEG